MRKTTDTSRPPVEFRRIQQETRGNLVRNYHSGMLLYLREDRCFAPKYSILEAMYRSELAI